MWRANWRCRSPRTRRWRCARRCGRGAGTCSGWSARRQFIAEPFRLYLTEDFQKRRCLHRKAPARRSRAVSAESRMREGARAARWVSRFKGSPLRSACGAGGDRTRQPAAGRGHRARFRPGLSGPLCDDADGEGRRRRDQDRAAAGRAAAPPRPARQEHDLSDRDAERQQARDHAEPEARARPRAACSAWSRRATCCWRTSRPG